jgi:Cdc6-like AAA superfamily ATPase
MTSNPFTYGKPISNPARFFGREREVDQVFSRLRNAEFESSSIVGDRRIGKTSLLYNISHPDVRQRYHLEGPDYAFVYADLQMVDNATTPVRLWQRLLRQLEQHCQDPSIKDFVRKVSTAEALDTFALDELFEELDDRGLHVILLLDEFEQVTTNPNFDPAFFYALRSLAIHHKLALLTSSRRELIELCHSDKIRSSPFFNIFANIHVSVLASGDARRLILEPLAQSDIAFTPENIEFLLDIAGTHPYFLQSACYFMFEGYQRQLSSEERMEFVGKAFRIEAAPHLSDSWHNSDDHEKTVLTAIALLEREGRGADRNFRVSDLQRLYTRSEETVGRLEKRGLVISEADHSALFNSSFGAWIIRELRAALREEQSYEEWLIGNKDMKECLSGTVQKELGEILPKIGAKYRDLVVTWASDPARLLSVAHLLKTTFGL